MAERHRTNLTIQLSEEDLNRIKAQYDLAESSSSTFLSTEPGAFSDVSNNPGSIVAQGLPPLQHIPDATPPVLRRFDLNMSSQQIQLSLSFSEPVPAARLQPHRLFLTSQSTPASTASVLMLQGAQIQDPAANQTQHTFFFPPPLVRDLQLARQLCTGQQNCFFSSLEQAVQDMAGNFMPALNASAALQVATYVSDATPPRCTAFQLNMDQGWATLNFSEVVDQPSINLTDAAFTSIQQTFPLQGDISFLSPFAFRVSFPTAYLNVLKADPIVGFSASTSALSFTQGFLRDTHGLPLQTKTSEPDPFTADSTPPQLLAFQFDASTSTLQLTFDEPVAPSSLDFTKLIINNNASQAVTLQGGSVSEVNDVLTIITAQLADADAIHIAQLEALAISKQSTFLRTAPGLIQDVEANSYTQSTNLPAATFLLDTTPPRLTAFSINMTSLRVDLHFSEVVNATSFDPTAITFQNSANNASYSLTGASWQSTQDETSLSFDLTTADANNIKLDTALMTSKQSAALAAASSLIADQAGNNVIAVASLQAATFTGDLVAPEVRSFELDMDAQTLVVDFTETISVTSIQPGFFAIQASASVPAPTNSSISQAQLLATAQQARSQLAVVLAQGSTVQRVSGSLTAVRITLTTADANAIKARHLLATAPETTFLALAPAAAQDMAGNEAVALPHAAALGLAATAASGSAYTPDSTSPRLLAFDLDMEAHTMTLVFDEPVQGARVNATSLVLQAGSDSAASAAATAGTGSHRINTATVIDPGNATQVVLGLDVYDINALKTQRGLVSGSNSTYLWFGQQLVQDMVGLDVVAVGPDAALAVRDYEADVSAPVVVSALLNMTTEQLLLGFDEPVDASSLSIAGQLVFVSRRAESAGSIVGGQSTGVYEPERYALQGGSVVGGAGTGATGQMLVGVSLTRDDVLALKVNRALLGLGPAAAIGSTEVLVGLTVRAGAVADMGSNGVQATGRNLTLTLAEESAVLDRSDVLATAGAYKVYPDTVAPELTAVVVDVNASRVVLNFDEPVNASTLVVQELTAMGGQGAVASGDASQFHVLQGGSTTSSDGTQVTVAVPEADLHAIQLLTQVWASGSTAWVRAGSGLVADMAGNAVVGTEQQAAQFIGDEVRPRIESVELDMDQGLLRVNLSEPVAVASVNASAIVLQRAALVVAGATSLSGTDSNMSAVWGNPYLQRLSASTTVVTQSNGLSFVLALESGDVDALKVKGIGRGPGVSNTWATAGSGLVADMAGRAVLPAVNGQNAIQASAVVLDSTAPSLVRFTLDMDAGVLELEFSEAVDSSTLSVDDVVLQGRQTSGGDVSELGWTGAYALQAASGSAVVTLDGPVQEVSLGKADVDALKLRYGVATRAGTTLLSFGPGLVQDHAGNSVEGVSSDAAVGAAAFTADASAPVVTAFEVSLSGAADDGAATASGRAAGSVGAVTTVLLSMAFDEPVQGAGLDVSSMELVSGDGQSYQLGVWSAETRVTAATATNGSSVDVVLGRSDADAVRAVISLCVSTSTCQLVHGGGLVQDMAGNAVSARVAGGSGAAGPLVADTFAGDTTPPVLEDATLDMDAGVLELVFSEAVPVLTFVPERVQLYGSACGSVWRYGLSGDAGVAGVAGVSEGGFVGAGVYVSSRVRVNVSESDLNEIRALAGVARGVGSTFVGLGAGGVYDMSGNSAVALVECGNGAVSVSEYEPDQTRPVLQSFVLDMDAHQLLLTFSETVNASTLDISSWVFYSLASLTSPSVTADAVNVTRLALTQLVVDLPIAVMHELESNLQLASKPANTFIGHSENAVRDMFGLGLASRPADAAMRASSVLPDVTHPSLVNASLSFGDQELKLTFSEPVLGQVLDPTAVVLTNGSAGGAHVRLSSASVSPSVGVVMTLSLVKSDVNTIKASPLCQIASSGPTDCFIAIGSELVTDAWNLSVAAIPASNALALHSVVIDNSSPVLTAFALWDMNEGVIELRFSETVLASSLTATQLWFDDSCCFPQESYRLTAFSRVQVDQTNVTLRISSSDLNNLKLKTDLCSAASGSDCWLRLGAGFVTDVFANPVEEVAIGDVSQARFPASVTVDNEAPVLEAVSVDMDTGLVELAFDEPVQFLTVVPSLIQLQNSNDSGTPDFAAVDLATSATISTANALNITLSLTQAKLLEIKAVGTLATAAVNTRLSLGAGAIKDMFENPNGAVDGRAASSFQADRTAPSMLVFASFDANDGYVRLEFDEPVNVSSFDATALVFQASGSSAASDAVPLAREPAQISYYAGSVSKTGIELNLNKWDLLNIKVQDVLCKSKAQCHISFSSSLVKDMQGLDISDVPASAALALATTFVADDQAPELTSFALDMDAGILNATFSDVVDPLSVDLVNTFRLQAQASITATASSGNTVNSVLVSNATLLTQAYSYTVQLQLPTSVLNEIKRRTALAVSQATTYLSLDAALLRDVAGFQVVSVVRTAAPMASTYVADATAPELVSFVLDVDAGTLLLTFSETVNMATLNTSDITLVSSSSGAAASRLALTSDCTVSTTEPRESATVTLTHSLLNALKQNPLLGTRRDDTFLGMTARLVQDMAGNGAAPRPADTDALLVDAVLRDQTPPELVQFDFNAQHGSLLLEFDEPVQATTLDTSKLTLVSRAAASQALELNETYVLTLAQVTVGVSNETFVNATLPQHALDALTALDGPGLRAETTFLALDLGAIEDVSGNRVQAIATGAAVAVTDFTADGIEPQLVSASLNMTSGRLNLRFTETIRRSSFHLNQLQLLNPSGAGAGVVLGDARILAPAQGTNDVAAEILLSQDLLNAIKALDDLATAANTTFVALTPLFCHDMSYNPLREVTAAGVDSFTPDQDQPPLLSFDLDMDSERMAFTFSETVRPGTLTFTSIELFGTAAGSPGSGYSLTGGSLVTSSNNVSFTVQLAHDDVLAIKGFRNIAASADTTFVRLSAGSIQDTAGNPSKAVLAPLSVTTYTADATPIRVLAFDLDLTNETINLTFSETLDFNTVNVTGFQLVGARGTSDDAVIVAFTQNDQPTQTSLVSISIALSKETLNKLKIRTGVATGRENTFLVVSQNAVSDMTGNSIQPIQSSSALQAATFTGDLVAPEVRSFELDMDAQTLVVDFTETISVTSIQPGFFAIQASASVPAPTNSSISQAQLLATAQQARSQLAVVLAQGSTVQRVSGSLTAVRITLTTADANAIKARHLLATAPETTFLALAPAAAQDMAGNEAVALPHAAALGLAATAASGSAYTPDSTSPRLLAFDLDMEAHTMTLVFDEPVQGARVNATSLVLQAGSDSAASAAATAGTGSHRINTATVIDPGNATQVVLGLDVYDINALKTQRGLVSGSNSTYLWFGQQLVQDMVGLDVVAVGPDAALAVRDYEADVSAPVVVSALLNMTTEQLLLGFDEPVDASSLSIAGQLVFVSRRAESAGSIVGGQSTGVYEPERYALQGGSVVGGAGTGATGQMLVGVSLTRDDVLALKVNRALLGLGPAAAIGSTEVLVGLTVRAGAVADMGSNGVQATGRNLTLTLAEESAVLDRSDVLATAGAYKVYPDTVAPELTAVVVDVNASRVVLNFDEPVNASTLVVQELTAMGGQGAVASGDASQFHVLQGGSTTSSDGTQVTVAVPEADLHAIQLLTQVWASGSTAWVRAGSGLVADMAGNAVVGTEQQAAQFIGDEVRPRIESVELDMDQGLLRVNLSEPVAVASVNASAIVLQRAALVVAGATSLSGTDSNMSAVWGNPYLQRLSASTTVVTQSNGLSFVLALESGDVDALKVKGIGRGPGVSNTWATAGSGLVADMAGRAVLPAVNGQNAIQASAVVLDSTAPSLVRFTLDMDAGVLELEFSEAVDSSTLSVDDVVLQGRQTSGGDVSELGWTGAYALQAASGSAVVTLDGPVQEVSLGKADVDALKLRYGVATRAGTTLLSFGPGLVQDHAGNSVEGVSSDAAVGAAAFTADASAPVVTAFEVSLSGAADDGAATASGRAAGSVGAVTTVLLSMAFDEPVQGAGLDVSSMELVSGDGQSYQLGVWSAETRVTAATATNGSSVDVVLGRSDADAVRAVISLCVSTSTCQLVHGGGLVQDMAGNAVSARVAGGSGAAGPLVADTFAGDTTPPVLEDATLDMDAGVLELVFSEAVPVLTFVPERVQLYGSACGSVWRYGLSGDAGVAGVAGVSEGGFVGAGVYVSSRVRVNVSESDLNEIRALAGVARGVGSTFVGLGAGGVYDMSGNSAVALVECGNGAVSVSEYEPDQTRPVLQSFVLDMDAHQLLLTFSETVNATTFSLDHVSFDGDSSVDLSSSVVFPTGLLSATINISTAAVRALEAKPLLCNVLRPGSSCSLAVSAQFVEDGFGNAIVAETVAASLVIADVTPPGVVAFELDMTLHKLVITFSEVVQVSSASPASLVLSNGVGSSVRLNSGTLVTSTSNATVVELTIGGEDLKQLELDPRLASSAASTLLSVESSFVVDMYGNAVSATSEIGTITFVRDSVKPTLVSWQLNMNFGLVTLRFSEVMNASSFDFGAVRIQDNALAYAVNGEKLAAMQLSGGTLLSGNNDTLRVLMTARDLNLLKRLDGVATVEENTYITLSAGGVGDMAGNGVVGVADGAALGAVAFVADTTPPSLTGFDLTQERFGYPMRLLMRFSETVDVTTLDVTKIVLQETDDLSQVSGTPEQKRLSGGTASPVPSDN